MYFDICEIQCISYSDSVLKGYNKSDAYIVILKINLQQAMVAQGLEH